jgi:hypothetical protein
MVQHRKHAFTPSSAEQSLHDPIITWPNVARLLVVISRDSKCAPRQDLQRRRGYTTWEDVQITSGRPITPECMHLCFFPVLLGCGPGLLRLQLSRALTAAIYTLHTVERTVCYSRSVPFLFDAHSGTILSSGRWMHPDKSCPSAAQHHTLTRLALR